MQAESSPSHGRGTIVARGLTRRFGAKVALAPLDLDLGPGGVYGLLGPNGSGKSTLLRLLTGLVPRDAGSAEVDGVALSGDGTGIRRTCTYSPGEIALYGELRARDHLDWLLRGRGRAARLRARTLAEELGLPLRQRVHAFSHGMKRQLLFAAALAPDVRVRILDEVSEGLDPSKRGAVLAALREEARRGTTILLSSHHLGEVESVCDEYVFLSEGRLIRRESAADFRRRAQRVVHVAFEEPPREDQRQALARLAAPLARARLDGTRAVFELQGDDPRPLLGALASARDLPPLCSVRLGELSLAELYRDLYGVEAI